MPARGEPLASSIIHDLRGRFAALQPYIQLLLEEGIGPLNEQQRECLEVIERNTEALFIATIGLLEVLRDDLDGLPLSTAPVPLPEILRVTAMLLRQHGVDVEITESGECLGELLVDANRVARILSALAVRAAACRLCPLSIAAAAHPGEGFVAIGVGSQAGVREIVVAGRSKGTDRGGLPMPAGDVGLTLAASLLQRQGGSLLGEGERFLVLLPLATPHAGSEGGQRAVAGAAADDKVHTKGR